MNFRAHVVDIKKCNIFNKMDDSMIYSLIYTYLYIFVGLQRRISELEMQVGNEEQN